jgi:hypothetical protein
MELTQVVAEVTRCSLYRRGLVLASSALASVLTLGCSTEPGDGLNDTSPPPTASSALQTSSPTSSLQPTQPQPATGASADVTITFNHAPQVTNVLSDVGRLDAGDRAQLQVIAHDPDGDKLTYAWTTECKGNFDRPASPTPVFTLDVLPTAGSCSLVVTVTDDHGGENQGILTLSAAPPPAIVVAGPSHDS